MGKKGDAAENARRKAQKRLQKQQKHQGSHQGTAPNVRTALKRLGLRVRNIDPDGNCQFSAVADQLYGDPSRYRQVRTMAISELQRDPDMYSGFITDDETFGDYCARMQDESEWGDMTTLMALAGAASLRVIVHQNNVELPRYELVPQHGKVRRTIHVLFDPDGEHYDSVRALGDGDEDPPKQIPWPGVDGTQVDSGSEDVADRLAGAQLNDDDDDDQTSRGGKASARSKRAPKAKAVSKKQLQEEMKAEAMQEARKEELSKTLAI